MAASYTVSLVSRVPAASGAPTLTELGGLVFDSLTYVDELNKAGSATLSCPVRSLNDTLKARLVNLAAFPSEIRVFRNEVIVWAGGIETVGIQGQNVQLGCVSLFGYVSRMGVMADYSPAGIDQFSIVKNLVDSWQARPYGNFGIDTSTVGTSGTVRTASFLQKDSSNVATKVAELSTMANGFDIWVNPSTRKLMMASPRRGADLSQQVFLDQRNIESASIAMSVAPADLVTDGSGTGTSQGTDGNSQAFWSNQVNSTRSTFGASWAGQSFDGTTDQSSLDGKVSEFVNARSTVMFHPGVSIKPRVGAQIGDFGPGDTIFYGYDAGLGYQSGDFRVSKISIAVDKSGDEDLSTEFV